MSVYDLTAKGNLVAIVTDGSAVLGLGDIGPRAALPVMEGKAVLFQTLAGVDAFPICLAARQVDEIVASSRRSPRPSAASTWRTSPRRAASRSSGGCSEALDIPVFHDDQHGTAVVTLAALINALRCVDKKIEDVRIVMNGAGAAGIAVVDLLHAGGREERRPLRHAWRAWCAGVAGMTACQGGDWPRGRTRRDVTATSRT